MDEKDALGLRTFMLQHGLEADQVEEGGELETAPEMVKGLELGAAISKLQTDIFKAGQKGLSASRAKKCRLLFAKLEDVTAEFEEAIETIKAADAKRLLSDDPRMHATVALHDHLIESRLDPRLVKVKTYIDAMLVKNPWLAQS